MIHMVNLEKQLDGIRQEVIDAVTEVLQSTHYVLGPRVRELEARVAEYCGASEAVGVASGTDALHLSLAALKVGEGDEVITTPFTFFATVESIIYRGARPVFVDIDADTFNMDAGRIEEKITPRTRAILPVHMFGHMADMKKIGEVARRHGLSVVEDSAQAFGAALDGVRAGSYGSAGCFSLYPSKNLGGCGDGGMIVVSNPSLARDMRRLRNHGMKESYRHERIGFNSRLDELQAAILLVKLRRIDQYNALRAKNAETYTRLLSGKVRCPVQKEGYSHVFHQYTIQSPARDEIKKRLAASDIASSIYYPIPLHLQEPLAYLGYREGEFEVAEKAAREVISLPMYPELEEAEIEQVAEIVLSV